MLLLLISLNQAGLTLYEVPFVYWEWEEEEKNVLELEHFGMGEIILIQLTLPKNLRIRAQFSNSFLTQHNTNEGLSLPTSS